MGLTDVTVLVGTFGDDSWRQLAESRAIPSARALGVPVIHRHAGSLHEARNAALADARTEWIIHLDADDSLDPNYLTAMATGIADLRAPAVTYLRGTFPTGPLVPRVAGHRHTCVTECLTYGNWIVVGACVRTDLVRKVGGWRDFEWSEDYDLWVRCWQAGATIEAIPTAIYLAHVRADSRNRAPAHAKKLAVHRAIAKANGLPIP